MAEVSQILDLHWHYISQPTRCDSAYLCETVWHYD